MSGHKIDLVVTLGGPSSSYPCGQCSWRSNRCHTLDSGTGLTLPSNVGSLCQFLRIQICSSGLKMKCMLFIFSDLDKKAKNYLYEVFWLMDNGFEFWWSQLWEVVEEFHPNHIWYSRADAHICAHIRCNCFPKLKAFLNCNAPLAPTIMVEVTEDLAP